MTRYVPEALDTVVNDLDIREKFDQFGQDFYNQWVKPTEPPPAIELPKLDFESALEPFRQRAAEAEQATRQTLGGFTQATGQALDEFRQRVVGGAPSGGTGAPDDIEGYIRYAAQRRGISPDIAVRVAQSEGGLQDPVRQSDYVNPRTGQREESYGPFQLHLGGGLGNAALKQGIDPRNSGQWKQAVDFALDNAATGGWGPWYGAARAGIANRQGLENARAVGVEPMGGASNAQPVSGARGNADQAAGRVTTSDGYHPVVLGAGENSYWTSGGTHGGSPAADIFAPIGTPIHAPISGTIRAFSAPLGGNAAILDGDDGRSYYMAHGAVPFASGRVERGAVIGQVGDTGNAKGTSPHLHMGISSKGAGLFDQRNGSGDITGDASWWGGGRPQAGGDAVVAQAPPSPSDTVKGVPIAQVVERNTARAYNTESVPPGRDDWRMGGLGTGLANEGVRAEQAGDSVSSGGTSPDVRANPPARDIQGDYAPRAVEPGDFVLPRQAGTNGGIPGAVPAQGLTPPTAEAPPQALSSPSSGGAVEPESTQAPASSGNPIVDLFSDFGRKLSGILMPQKPDYRQAAQDIQQRQATLTGEGTALSDLIGPDAPQSPSQRIYQTATQPLVSMAEGSQQEMATFQGLMGRKLQGETLTDDEEALLARSTVNVVGDVSGLQNVGKAVPGVIGRADDAVRAARGVDNAPTAGIVSRAQADEAGRTIAAGGEAAMVTPKVFRATDDLDPVYEPELIKQIGAPVESPIMRPDMDFEGLKRVVKSKARPLPDDVTLYHITPADNISNVQKRGLGGKSARYDTERRWGDESPSYFDAFNHNYRMPLPKDVLYAADNIGPIGNVGRDAFADNGWSLLRFKPGARRWAADPETNMDFRGAWITKESVTPNEIEVWTETGWRPLIEKPPPAMDRYYHGTGSDFARPDLGRAGTGDFFNPAYFVADNPAAAMTYATTAQSGALRVSMSEYPSAVRGIAEALDVTDEAVIQDMIKHAYRNGSETGGLPLYGLVSRMLGRSVDRDEVELARQAAFSAVHGVGPNIRAVDIPSNLRLLDLSNPTVQDDAVLNRIINEITPNSRGNLHYSDPAMELRQRFRQQEMSGDLGHRLNRSLADAGYDGIRYESDLDPVFDESGRAIAHSVVGIFPESLDKIRNATAGTPGGLLPGDVPQRSGGLQTTEMLGAGGRAVATGAGTAYEESQREGSTPESVLRAGIGGAATSIATRGVGRFLKPGRRVPMPDVLSRAAERVPEDAAPSPERVMPPTGPRGGQIPRQDRAAELSRPIALTTKEEIDRLRLDKFPVEARAELLNAAQDTSYGARLRRGVLGDKEVQQLAQEYAPTVEQAIRASHRGKAYNAEEVIMLRNLMTQQDLVVRELTKEITEKGFDVGLAAQLTAERGALRSLGEIVFGGAPAEAGRALRAFRQDAQNILRNPSRAGADYLKKQFGSLDKAEEAIAKYQQMVDDGADPVALVSFLRNAHGGWLNRLSIVRYAGMLAQTTTQAINAGGGVLANLTAVGARPLMVGMDVARAKATGAPREVFAAEIGAQLHGMRAGAQQGLKEAAFILQHGFHPDDITQIDHVRAGFGTNIPRLAPEGSRRAAAVDLAFEYPLRAMVAADAIMRGTAKGGYAAAEATAAAIKARRTTRGSVAPEVLREFMSNPKIAQRAEELARRDVLQEDTAMRRFNGWLRQQPGALAFGISQVMPFSATPYAIVAQGVGMTPPAAVVKAVLDAKAGKGARHAQETLARSMIGTSVMGVAAWQYANGNLTGPYPEDAAARSTLPPGWREWSVKSTDANGETKYYPLAPLGALGLPAAVAIMMVEEHKQKGTIFSPEALGKIGLGVGKYMVDQTSMRGMSDLAEAMSRGGGAMDRLIEGIASSYSPHVLGGGGVGRQLQQLMGMPMRDPGNALEALLATHPATAGMVPESRDILGRPRTNSPDDVPEALLSTVVRSSEENDAPVIRAFRESGAGLSRAPKDIRGVALTREQQAEFLRIKGQTLTQLAGTMVQGDEFNRLPKDVRARVLDKLEQSAREMAEAQTINAMGSEFGTRRLEVVRTGR